MFDYSKLNISYLDFETLKNNPLLNWSFLVDSNGEVVPMFIDFYQNRRFRPLLVAEYKGLHFERYEYINGEGENISETFVRGSLHKYDNDGKHNADSYTLQRHIEVLRRLEKEFGIIPNKTTIHHIEISTLFNVSYSIKNIVDNILLHRTRGAKPERYNYLKMATPSIYKVAKHKQYQIKCYCKSLQYNLDSNLFRFELKYSTMERLNGIGFKTLDQTINLKYIKLLHYELLKRWNETLLYDWTIDKKLLQPKERIALKDYCNAAYWINLSSDQRHYQSRKYQSIVSQYSENVHQYIARKIKESSDNLTASVIYNNNDKLSNSIGSHNRNSARRYPDEIYNLKPQDPERKKLRNNKTNRMASIELKIKELLRVDRLDLLSEIITSKDLEYFEDLRDSSKWCYLIKFAEMYV